MTNPQQLDNASHKDLRVRLKYGAAFGDNVGTVLAFPTEFGDLQREYPIFFRRDTNGEYFTVALLGFAGDENLYLDGDRWDAAYLPGIIARGPFMIGFQDRQEGGETKRQAVIHVDMDHPRVSQTEGERVFLDDGSHSPYLRRVTRVLEALNEGYAVTKAMFKAYDEAGLIAPVDLEIKLTGQEPTNLRGFFAIDREKLLALEPEALHKLNKSGLLQGAYLMLASHGNLERLIERKVRRMARAAA